MTPATFAATKPGWTGTDIGGAVGGADTYTVSGTQETFTLVGKGTGLSISGDQMKFTSTSVAGDFQITARLLKITGSSGAQAGIALRQDFSGSCPYMSAASFVPGVASNPSGRPNSLGLFVRKTPLIANTWYTVLNPTDMPVPSGSGKYCWFRMIRKGNDVAMYRACADNSVSDLTTKWSPIYTTSGGAFVVSGSTPVQVGLFVTSGSSTQATTAVFDRVSIVTPSPTPWPFKSSWIGNDSEADSTSYVSGNAKAMWVSPDGKCYVNGAGDEAGQSAKIYQWSGTGQIGQVVKRFDNPPSGNGWEGSITGNYASGTGNVFLTGAQGICMTDLNGSNPKKIYIPNQTVVANIAQISGLAWGNGVLYVSNPADGRVYVSGTTLPGWIGSQSVMLGNLAYTGSDGKLGDINTVGVVTATDSYQVNNPAPEEVYQTQFQGGTMTFNISATAESDPDASYKVRLHFAEFGESGTNQRIMNITVAGLTTSSSNNYRILTAAHGVGIAHVMEFPNMKFDSNQKIAITLKNLTKAEAVINGIEVTKSDGTAYLAYNCGGPSIRDATSGSVTWQGSTSELDDVWHASTGLEVHGSFSGSANGVTRPGPLAFDSSRGELWVVQEGGPFPTSTGRFDLPAGQASIRCFSGAYPYVYKNKAIVGLTNPTAICYDSAQDRLLVTEDGPDQNIRIYTNLSGTVPALAATFGATKGVFSGSSWAGQVYVPADHGYARFYGPTGVGVDSSRHVCVVCNPGANVTDLKAFVSTGTETLLWKQRGLEFCNVGDFDSSVGPSSIWTPSFHYTMNYDTDTPGGEWGLKSYLWNPFLITGTSATAIAARTEPRSAAATAVYRTVNGHPFIYTSGQGTLMATLNISGSSKAYGLDIFRFKGSTEQLVRCGELTWRATRYLCYWNDTDGNGVEEAEPDAGYSGDTIIPDDDKELKPQDDKARLAPDMTTTDSARSFDVDGDGNIYLAVGGTSHQPFVFRVPIGGLDSNGAPIYLPPPPIATGTAAGKPDQAAIAVYISQNKTSLPATSYFSGTGWGTRAHLRYAKEDGDTMYLEGDRDPNAGSRSDDGKGNYGGVVECWTNWSGAGGTPQMKYRTILPDPGSEPNFVNGAPPYSQVDGFCYEAMDVANRYVFVSDNWGSIQVLDPTGKIVAKLYAGPEVSGISGWTDAIMGLRVHYNPDPDKKEYLILQECAGFRQRQNLYRWTPPSS